MKRLISVSMSIGILFSQSALAKNQRTIVSNIVSGSQLEIKVPLDLDAKAVLAAQNDPIAGEGTFPIYIQGKGSYCFADVKLSRLSESGLISSNSSDDSRVNVTPKKALIISKVQTGDANQYFLAESPLAQFHPKEKQWSKAGLGAHVTIQFERQDDQLFDRIVCFNGGSKPMVESEWKQLLQAEVKAPEHAAKCAYGQLALADGTCVVPAQAQAGEDVTFAKKTEVTFDDGDIVEGWRDRNKFIFKTGDEIAGKLAKPINLSADSPERPTFPCDRVRGNLTAWKRCMEKTFNTTKVADLSLGISDRFSEEFKCPETVQEIEPLRKIVQSYDSKPFDVDFNPLIAYPAQPKSGEFEAHLPIFCGINFSVRTLFPRLNTYFESNDSFRLQENENSRKRSAHFVRLPRQRNLFMFNTSELTSMQSWRKGGNHGDARFVPIGNGVYIQTYRNPRRIFYYGLVIVPTRERFLQKACKKKQWLDQNVKALNSSELNEATQVIAVYLQKSHDLDQAQKMSKTLHESEAQLTRKARKEMRGNIKWFDSELDTEFSKLSEDRKQELAKIWSGTDACIELESISDRGASNKEEKSDAGSEPVVPSGNESLDAVLGVTGAK